MSIDMEKLEEIRSRHQCKKDGAPMGNKNAAGPHNMSGSSGVSQSGHNVQSIVENRLSKGGNPWSQKEFDKVADLFRAQDTETLNYLVHTAAKGMSSAKSEAQYMGQENCYAMALAELEDRKETK